MARYHETDAPSRASAAQAVPLHRTAASPYDRRDGGRVRVPPRSALKVKVTADPVRARSVARRLYEGWKRNSYAFSEGNRLLGPQSIKRNRYSIPAFAALHDGLLYGQNRSTTHSMRIHLMIVSMKQMTRNILIRCIRLYQRYTPRCIRNCCRYTPTCSEYAIIVIQRHGFIRGVILAFLRIARCVPPFGGTDWPKGAEENCHGTNKLP